MQLLAAARRRGVDVRILTNSLASTDVVSVHSGYAPRRKRLVAEGLDVYELQPDATLYPGTDESPRGVPTTLHAKSGTADDIAFIGSANLDQRSSRLNTEMMMVVQSPAIARRVAAFVTDGMRARNAWLLAPDGRSVAWLGDDRGGILEHRGPDPESSAGRRMRVRIFSLLPIEGLL
jgi:putative cardiolipin synthase